MVVVVVVVVCNVCCLHIKAFCRGSVYIPIDILHLSRMKSRHGLRVLMPFNIQYLVQKERFNV